MIIKNLLNTKKIEKTPIWIMRQAGRHLPEYRAIREKNNLLNMFFSPKIIKEVTLQPIHRYGLDAAIIFSDILVIPFALGMDLNFGSDSKPKLEGIEKVISLKVDQKNFKDKLKNIYEAISLTKKEIKDQKDFIGFSGGAWTLYMYMFSGGSSSLFPKIRAEAFKNAEQTSKMLDFISEAIFLHMEEQIKSGVNIVKIFESEAGTVSDLFFDEFIIKPSQKIISKLKEKYPEIKIIYFPRGSSFRYKDCHEKIDADVIAVDHFLPINWVKENITNKIKQGNLDPAVLFCEEIIIEKQVRNIERSFGKGEYIFNLGHGILPNTPVEKVKFLVELLRE